MLDVRRKQGLPEERGCVRGRKRLGKEHSAGLCLSRASLHGPLRNSSEPRRSASRKLQRACALRLHWHHPRHWPPPCWVSVPLSSAASNLIVYSVRCIIKMCEIKFATMFWFIASACRVQSKCVKYYYNSQLFCFCRATEFQVNYRIHFWVTHPKMYPIVYLKFSSPAKAKRNYNGI